MCATFQSQSHKAYKAVGVHPALIVGVRSGGAVKPASPSHSDGIADDNTVSRYASRSLRSETCPKLSFLYKSA